MTRLTTPRNFWAHAIAALGGGIVLIELLRYWVRDHAMEGGVIAIGFAIAFVGAYMADRKGAIEGGSFLVDSTAKILAVVRSGRRSTDSVVVQKAAIVPAPAAPLPTAPPQVEWEHGEEEGVL